ncbi:Putative zinc-or iron-chelating domain-containing protein [Desulfomicrobium apsheronum]|uniref:Putative zinc-or iron-chelating domain-containing protein n=1 Tax=Desulfomicrobium apsheronum TaxID=52560 RepID=A0A1I3XPM4_9BACT|nr:YkgJ family cysteine cluster protein [Desulfomicrobium apsheronum]SFK21458.1 Putative zinc-or iron-chelating domain-containing protein [Desulfomicrobium apsheronum]
MTLSTCRRCGTCCEKGGPALHEADKGLLEHIPMKDVVCLRRGELAFDPRTQSLQPLPLELMKIRGKGAGWECVYFLPREKSCSVYGHRPLECRSLFCADTDAIHKAMAEPTLTREDIVQKGSGLWTCIEEHENSFSVTEALGLAKAEQDCAGAICSELDDLIRREIHFRRVLAEKVGAKDEDLWAYFGRPLWLALLPLNPEFSRYDQV